MRYPILSPVVFALLVTLGSSSATAQIPIFETQKLLAGDASASDLFGSAVSVDGETLVIGAPEDSDAGVEAGSAYVFLRSGDAWTQQAKLEGMGTDTAQLGTSVSIDGNTLALGAPFDDASGTDAGRVFVFVRNGSAWDLQGTLVAGDALEGDRFGTSVSVGGNTVVVGAPGDDDLASNAGSVYVFSRVGSAWSQTGQHYSNEPVAGGLFGGAVDIDGPLFAVGAPASLGKALVFTRQGAEWNLEQVFAAPPEFSDDSNQFGTSVAIEDDTLVVGAPNLTSRGFVFAYRRSGSTWGAAEDINPLGTTCCQRFGTSVDVSGDRIVVGAPLQPTSAAGTAWIFGRVGDSWIKLGELRRSDAEFDEYFGTAVALSGTSVFTGSPRDGDGGDDSGSVYKHVAPPIGIGSPFCFGDGSGAPCPCGNESAPGAGEGCRIFPGFPGTRLVAWGSTSFAEDELSFGLTNGPLIQPALLYCGTGQIDGGAGVPFGNGLRCVGGETFRLSTTVIDGLYQGHWGPGLGVAYGAWNPGDTRHFQAWFRNQGGGYCGTASFNLSNALAITLEP